MAFFSKVSLRTNAANTRSFVVKAKSERKSCRCAWSCYGVYFAASFNHYHFIFLVDIMDTAQLESITSAAMTLSERERAKLAHDLVASLDGPADISVAEAWDTEICRRINDIEAGKTELLDAEETITRARARIRS